MRLFVAVELSDAARAVLAWGLSDLKRDQPDARWVRTEALHLTLKFIGEQDAAFVAAFAGALPVALAGCAPVAVQLGGGGFFPHRHRARVAWVGTAAPGLEVWARAIDEAAVASGVAREARPWSPHLTLARIERPWGEKAAEHFMVAVGKWRFEPFIAAEVVIFSSDLRPSGAVHTVLYRFRVGGNNAR